MKAFKVENTRRGTTIKVILQNPPYEIENILYKTGYKEKDCIITDLSEHNAVDLTDYASIDNVHDEKENSLMGRKIPGKNPFMKKKPKEKK